MANEKTEIMLDSIGMVYKDQEGVIDMANEKTEIMLDSIGMVYKAVMM